MNLFRLSFVLFILKWSTGKESKCSKTLLADDFPMNELLNNAK